MKKSEIIQAIIQEEKEVIADLEKAIKVYRNASDLDEEDTLDPEDLSHQTEYKEMQLRLENKLQRKEAVIVALAKFKDTKVDTITNGAVVETDKMYLYIGTVAHPIMVNNKKVLGISLKAPIMATLADKKVGETVKIGKETHTIKNIL